MKSARILRRGFTLIEVLVTLAVVSLMTVGMLNVLDSANKVSKEQTNLADAQASSRSGIYEISRVARQARTGQLSFENAIIPEQSNAGIGVTYTDLAGTAHTVREGTDVLRVRGIIYGDTYVMAPEDVTCGGSPCTPTSTSVSVTIRQRVEVGSGSVVNNYTPGNLPTFTNRTTPFLFVVSSARNQNLTTTNGKTYAIPMYLVGLVNAGGPGWYTAQKNPALITFTMDATNSYALEANATGNPAQQMSKPFSGGVLDDVMFFVDRGEADRITGKYVHPVLSQAILDPSTGNWDIQPIADDVEDFQVAYGIDGSATVGAQAGVRDRGLDPAMVSPNRGEDEWVGNAGDGTVGGGEVLQPSSPSGTVPVQYEAFIDTTYNDPATPSDPNRPPLAVPALKALMLSLVVKSHEPDMQYEGSGAWGVKIFDSTAVSISDKSLTGAAGSLKGLPFRRRVQTMAVTVRNYL